MSQETAEFVERASCIACGSVALTELSEGLYGDEPVRSYIENDPWGDNPMPYLDGQRWQYVKCAACDQAFHRYILTPKWNEIRFSRWMTQAAIAEFEQRVNTPQRRLRKACEHAAHALRLERMTREIRGESAVRVLDFGCGYGEFLAMCSQFGFEAVGIDRSSARRENSKLAKIFAEIDDLKSAPEGATGFHALTLFEVLEHLDEPAPLLQSLSEFLVAGGTMILETPDCSGVTDLKSRSDYLKIAPMEHINGFTPQSLRRFSERLGFVQVQPPIAQVTADPVKVLKNEVRRIAGSLIKPTTRLYFRKL
jgi:2-polyprenyl-3-methyl-5-hydroxy-6-metoxy-1,4-benzoquinol methylase